MSGFYNEIKASSGIYKYYVNGEWKESTSDKSVGILNPTSNETVYKVQGGDALHIPVHTHCSTQRAARQWGCIIYPDYL